MEPSNDKLSDSMLMRVADIVRGKATPEHTQVMNGLKPIKEQIADLNRKAMELNQKST